MAESGSKLKCGRNLIGVVDHIVLISALVVGLGALLHSNSISILVFGTLVLIGLLIGVCLLMSCRKPNPKGNNHLLDVAIICIRLWCSCVLGLMSFVDISAIQNDVKTAITWMLLASSTVIKAYWSIEQRCFGLIKYSTSPVTWVEMFELVGFSVAGLSFLPEDQGYFSRYALFLIFVSFAVSVVAVRLVAFFNNPYTILVLISVIVCQVVFFTTVDVPFNVAALGCFAGRLYIDPVFDLFSSNISIEGRLNCVFSIHGCFQKMFIKIFIVFEGVFFLHAGVSDIYHKAWYLVVLFVVLFVILLRYHYYFIHLCWHFSEKMSECAKAYQALKSNISMEKIMATRGMRLQAQLTHCLTYYTLGSTVLLGAFTLLIPCEVHPWHKEDKAALAASFLIVLLVEGMFFAATDTLRILPGACRACVIMPPSSSHGQSELKELRISIMDFFQHNAIPCSIESFVDELSVQTLEGKLEGFFAETIPDTYGRRYDSYVVYYCGDVDSDGKWELTGGKFKFEEMQRLWNICNTQSLQSRLILIQDAKYCEDWLEKITKDKNNKIAMQACKLNLSRDSETGVGDFTRDWIKFNSSTENSINWKEWGRKITAVYEVSLLWSDNHNEFHVHTEKDIKEFTSKLPTEFNEWIKTLLISAQDKKKTNCLPRWGVFMMSWFPPPFIDTGHGFKLVRS